LPPLGWLYNYDPSKYKAYLELLKVAIMKPRLFIGSSSQRLPIARALKQLLADSAEVAIWDEAPEFGIGHSILDGLIKVSMTYDFALLAFGQDDCTMMGGVEMPAVRDNVIF
jgi:predicted nucleotide-binding protein